MKIVYKNKINTIMRTLENNDPIDFTKKKKERDRKKFAKYITTSVGNAFANQHEVEEAVKNQLKKLRHNSKFEELPQVPLFRKDYMRGLPSYEYLDLSLPLYFKVESDEPLDDIEKFAVEYGLDYYDKIMEAGNELINDFKKLTKIADRAIAPQYPRRYIASDIEQVRRLLDNLERIKKHYKQNKNINEKVKPIYKTMYHGTSKKYLPSILKHGLMVEPPEKIYSGAATSYGGIYLDKRFHGAVRSAQYSSAKTGYDPIVIEVKTLVSSTKDDEDTIIIEINDIIRLLKKMNITDNLWERVFEEIKDRFKLKDYAKNKLIDWMEFFKQYYDNKEFNNLGELLEDDKFRDFVDFISKNSKFESTTKRILNPIKFKGKTKIVKIYELPDNTDNHPLKLSKFDKDNWKIIYPKNKINEGLFRVYQTMYHGTSSKNLPLIMKYGLIPNPSKKVWSKGEWESLQGVYITADKDIAIDAAFNAISIFGGNPTLIEIKTLVSSTKEDEDKFNELFGETLIKLQDAETDKNWTIFFNVFFKKIMEEEIILNKKGMKYLGKLAAVIKRYIKYPDDDAFLDNFLVDNIYKMKPITKYIVDIITLNMVWKEANTKRIRHPVKFKGKTRITKILIGVEHDFLEFWPNNQLKQT